MENKRIFFIVLSLPPLLYYSFTIIGDVAQEVNLVSYFIIDYLNIYQVYVPNHPNNTIGLPTPTNPINFSTNSLSSSNEGMNGGAAPPLSLQHPATFSSLIYQQPRSNIQLYNQLQVPYSSNRYFFLFHIISKMDKLI